MEDENTIKFRFNANLGKLELKPRYNASPSQLLPVILNTDPHRVTALAWGLRPGWLKAISKKEGLINVRAETLRERKTFAKDLAERRCLVLADGFYEWRKTGSKKVPYRFTLKDGGLFAFAGIWEENTDDEGNPLKTFAVITTEPNELVKQVHNRMPVILQRSAEESWLKANLDPQDALASLVPYPAQLMKSYEVSTLVNRATVDTPDIIKPV
jgi:putative SOS response-associated peptidase YedK